ncbi:unnamed protein product [Nippostrongylus brasiliensis]|uniref:Neur_chan_memb domain-containing protein n=1 Tax=Nippostrongylus brasiliensis TaxID=27835 RepID=A0A0N4YTN2_NIPBR|nr:unnamed protein product [Nippostrongylus brasiliensis]
MGDPAGIVGDPAKTALLHRITTLLAMSILMLMVSDQMPTTSEFVPLIAWFYLSIIIIISIGTFLTSVVLSVQSRRQYGRNPPIYIRYYFFVVIPSFIYLSVPPALEKLWAELDVSTPLKFVRLIGVQSTLRIPRPGLDRFNSIQMIDVSVPPSPAMSRLSRTPSIANPRPTLWEGTMSALAGTNTQLRRTSAAFSREVDGMRKKRQCSLEWEFLATVLDRFLLLLFISAVVLITMGLVVVGKMAQFSYDHPDESFF